MLYTKSVKKKIVVFGATNLDISCTSKGEIVKYDSNPGDIKFSFGGVGHNIALNLKLLSHDVHFITPIGNDLFSSLLSEHLGKYFYSGDIVNTNRKSGVYVSFHSPSGEMEVGVNDMSLNDTLKKEDLFYKKELLNESEYVILDSNMSEEALTYVVDNTTAFIAADCVSTKKAERLLPILQRINILKPNLIELEHLSGIKVEDLETLRGACFSLLDKGVFAIIVTLGKDGSFYCDKRRDLYLPSVKCNVVNATGAGDSFLSAFFAALIRGNGPDRAMKEGTAASLLTLMTNETVNLSLNREKIYKKVKELYNE